MNDRIKDAFDSVHASWQLKDSTKRFVAQRLSRRSQRSHTLYKGCALAAACLVIALMCFGGYHAYFTAVSVISIDINPSIELGINRFDRVVSVEGYNDDGTDLAAGLDIKSLYYTDALERVLSCDDVAALLEQGEVVSIAVVGSDDSKNAEMLKNVRQCTAGHQNTYCHSASLDEVEAAHDIGLSYGKYRALLQLWELDPDITAQQVSNMTMREIRELIQSLLEQSGSNEGLQSQSEGGWGGSVGYESSNSDGGQSGHHEKQQHGRHDGGE